MRARTQILGTFVYFDANVLIYAVEGITPWAAAVHELFSQIDRGQMQGITSEMALAEVLVIPLRNALTNIERQYRQLLSPTSALMTRPVARKTLEDAAALRALYPSVRLADAIHVATAIDCGCSTFLTNDQRIPALPA